MNFQRYIHISRYGCTLAVSRGAQPCCSLHRSDFDPSIRKNRRHFGLLKCAIHNSEL